MLPKRSLSFFSLSPFGRRKRCIFPVLRLSWRPAINLFPLLTEQTAKAVYDLSCFPPLCTLMKKISSPRLISSFRPTRHECLYWISSAAAITFYRTYLGTKWERREGRGGEGKGGAITVYIQGCCNIRNWHGDRRRRPFRMKRRHATRPEPTFKAEW